MLSTTNFVAPDLEAVNRSPTPLLPTIREANDDVAEIVAEGRVPMELLISTKPRDAAPATGFTLEIKRADAVAEVFTILSNGPVALR